MTGLLLSKDLMFASRVTGAARQLSQEVLVAATTEELLRQKSDAVGLVMIDLFRFPVEDLASVVTDLCDGSNPPHVVAYGPHVDEALLDSARQAGCDEVLTRGQFHQQMGDLLKRYLQARDS